ncbi:hypothetical protein [Methylobacterium sp. B4]|uniref:hypothetical protein n=1 Tax=Methylobacterium sp. B4 TaxID=1938755 RepID=UPI000D76767A|nr:hypothetical protein [Methylobacterium sp. B4]PXW51303.1 hypothetical protein BY998_13524 [Methylobacterium sp. B4]
MKRSLLVLIALTALVSPVLAQTRALPPGEIRANGDITFGNALKLGKREGNKTVITPDTLQILGKGSTGDVSDMDVAPAVGSAARALKNKLLDFGVSVLDFGPSVGAGGDDSVAFNAALQAACYYGSAQVATKTCEVLVPEPPSGAYNLCSSPINLPGGWASVTIRGVGGAPKIRIKPDCTSGIDRVINQPVATGDSSAARVRLHNLTLDGYCKAKYNLYIAYAVGFTATSTVFRNVAKGDGANVWVNGGYELDFDNTNRIENVNEVGHKCYNSQADLPDYNLVTYSSDSVYKLYAINARVANYYNANGGYNHYVTSHGWGYTGPWPIFADSNLAPMYNYLVVGGADLTNVTMDNFQTAGIYLKGGLDGNGNPTGISGALVTASAALGTPAAPAVLLDPGLKQAVITGNNFGNRTSAVRTVSGPVDPTVLVRNNNDTDGLSSAVIARPVSGGDTARMTAGAAGAGAAMEVLSPNAAASLELRAKGQAVVRLSSNGFPAFNVYSNNNSANGFQVTANSAGSGPLMEAVGSDPNIVTTIIGKGASGLVNGFFVYDRDPNGGDIPNRGCADWNNTTANTFKRVCNFGGTLRSVSYN